MTGMVGDRDGGCQGWWVSGMVGVGDGGCQGWWVTGMVGVGCVYLDG